MTSMQMLQLAGQQKVDRQCAEVNGVSYDRRIVGGGPKTYIVWKPGDAKQIKT